jgi:hypothetical protein
LPELEVVDYDDQKDILQRDIGFSSSSSKIWILMKGKCGSHVQPPTQSYYIQSSRYITQRLPEVSLLSKIWLVLAEQNLNENA